MDAVIAIEQVARACPRSADVVQAGSFGPIRTFAEYAAPALKAKFLPELLAGRSVHEPRHVGAGRRLGGDRPRHDGAARTAPMPSSTAPRCSATFSADAAVFLVYARFGPGVGGIGSVDRRARHAGLSHRARRRAS